MVPQHLDVNDTDKSRILFHHYQHAKIIQSICSNHHIICEITFARTMIYTASPILDHAHPMIIELLAFLNLYEHAKNLPDSLIHS